MVDCPLLSKYQVATCRLYHSRSSEAAKEFIVPGWVLYTRRGSNNVSDGSRICQAVRASEELLWQLGPSSTEWHCTR